MTFIQSKKGNKNATYSPNRVWIIWKNHGLQLNTSWDLLLSEIIQVANYQWCCPYFTIPSFPKYAWHLVSADTERRAINNDINKIAFTCWTLMDENISSFAINLIQQVYATFITLACSRNNLKWPYLNATSGVNPRHKNSEPIYWYQMFSDGRCSSDVRAVSVFSPQSEESTMSLNTSCFKNLDLNFF